MTNKRADKIAEHLAQIPKIHRADYTKAVSGRSRKAGVKSFCLQCVGWQKEEVRLCTSLECALYPYRPYKVSSNKLPERSLLGPDNASLGKGELR